MSKRKVSAGSKNIEDLDDIWERLTDKYGNTVDIVDSVIQEVQNATIPRNNQANRALVEFIGVLERGVQDLKAIEKESEIATAYTVRIIEEKLPDRVHLKWLEQEQSETGYQRFMD